MTSGKPMLLEGRGLRVIRDGRAIIDGIDLSIARGETVAIEGPSGSGKSTLVRTLATLIAPDEGDVLLEGVSAARLPPREFRTQVAYVAQSAVMFPGTVEQNVSTGPELRGEKLDSKRAKELLTMVELDPAFARREASTLSGGERQRVALARALANSPRVLLLDEPTAALDPATGLQIVSLVRSLASSGLSIAMVTHLQAHAEALGGSRYVCERGKLRSLQP